MDSYFLTKEDWDAILELGVGPMDGDTIKIDSQTKSTFTRLYGNFHPCHIDTNDSTRYNQKSHPMPFMKASNVVAPSRAAISKPDLEEAIEESEGEEVLPDKAEDDDNDMDISKDKYIKQPKKKPAASKAGQKKGKGKDESAEEESAEEDVKPKKGQGGKKVTAAGKGKAKR
jgi:replication factor C subunit 1